MKNIITSIFAIALVAASGTSLFAQSTLDGALEARITKGTISGAQMGSLICENANGERVLCSGALEQTVLGIVTNVPYVTVNKPANPNGSKFIFEALVSSSNGALSKGDFLVAGKEGRLVLSNDANQAYAVLLDDIAIDGKARVKVLQDKSK